MTKIDFKFKLTLLGEGSVGKTSLILRYVKNYFKEDLKSTIGTNFMIKDVEVDGKNVQLLINDIGAQNRFKSMREKYFQGSAASIAVFDVTRVETLHALPEWIKSVKATCGNIPVTIVGNKSDLDSERTVSPREGQSLADRFTCQYSETSAKTGDNVEEIFRTIVKLCLENFEYYH